MVERAVLLVSDDLGCYRNLALEEVILNHRLQGEMIVLLYVNRPCVVIGKNQNPWRECLPGLLTSRGVRLARRVSGGGAVYHDEGNLNFSFFLPRAEFEFSRQFRVIKEALSRLGVQSECGERKDLFVGGRKVSGQAFCYRRETVLHHGTILVTTSPEAVREALERPFWKFDSRGVSSVRSSVTSLEREVPGISVEEVRKVLTDVIEGEFSNLEGPLSSREWIRKSGLEDEWEELTVRYGGWDWIFGWTPEFEVTVPMGTGTDGLTVRVRKGYCGEVRGCVERYPMLNRLQGLPFRRREWSRVLESPVPGLEETLAV